MYRLDHFTVYRLGLITMLTLTLFACSGGGGCSGCAGCGIAPIPDGFPLDQRIDNSAQVRLTQSGITFIEDNIDGIVATFLPDGLDFTIDEQNVSFGISITICRGGGCVAHIEIDSVDIVPTDPNLLRAHLRLILDSRNAAGMRAAWPGTCDIDINTREGSRPYVGMNVDIRVQAVDAARPARGGYTEIVIESLELDDGEPIENDDIDISGGFLGSCGLLNLGLLKGFVIDQVKNQIGGLADSALGDALCTTQGEFGCPDGTTADGAADDPSAVCRYSDGVCASTLLGMDGQGDLGGQLIGGFSPGTHAYAQFLLAAGGDGEAVNEGMSVFMYGGFRGTNSDFSVTPAHNSCVPVVEPPPLPTIPRVDSFRGNVIPGTSTETHVGIGIAESFMDYAGYGLFDSGALCIGAGTRLSQQLSTGLLSAAIMSVPELTYPLDAAAVTIAIRPQQPPDFTLGSGGDADPILQIALPQAQMDFYVWSTERYIRFMTFQTDLDIGINLTVEAGEIVPSIVYVNSNNPVVTNSELLAENPDILANTISTIIGSFASMLGGAISPFALPEIMGFELDVPDGGLTSVADGGENFLGIFANLRLAAAMPLVQPVETSLDVTDLRLDRESMDPAHWAEGRGNQVWLTFAGSGIQGVEYEYSYRIDGTSWSAWTTDERILVDDDILLLQARHEIEARSRVVGEPATVDLSPATAELIVDIIAPRLNVGRTVEGVEVTATDLITPADQLEYRYFVDGSWTPWGHRSSYPLATDASGVRVEVRDEAGNVGSSQAALIRGLPNTAAGGGCGCRVQGDSDSSSPFGLLALLGALGAVFLRRRRGGRSRAKALLAVIGLGVLAIVVSGCECGSPPAGLPCGGRCMPATPPAMTAGSICCEATDMCSMYDVDALCEPGYTCPIDNLVQDAVSCDVTCSACMAKPAITPGILATDLDMVVDDAGQVFVSGYNPGNPSGLDFGDLVFGQWNGTAVDWEIVDGAPTTPITNDPNGWRGGVSAPGPDVGRWTSLANQSGTFLITYYDVGAGALRFAAGGPGSWSSHTIDDEGDSGRYSSLVVMADGTPVVSYLRMAEDPSTPGAIRGSVMVAMANTMNPSAPTDWTITEVASAPMPCRPFLCGGLTTCLESGLCVTPSSDCTDTCGSGTTCSMGSCQASLGAGYVEDLPPAYGLYTSLAVTPTGLALVWYDRTTGNIFGSAYDGAAWGAAFHIDGYQLADPNVGDSGQGASLAVDSTGLWHVAYIDGAEETLRYAQVQSSGTVVSREIVDDGSTSDGTMRFTDGRHIIGDDASIVVDAGGGVRVVYQDATSGTSVVATRGAGGGPWAIARFDTEGSSGYWLEQQLLGTTSYAVSFWRQRMGRTMNSGVRVTTLDP
ncbi:MAG: MYXO-CTERM sorting domain-containing protein [Sandaracinaceae bacterium]|nr:MYXO-CTERM sorting domain-containing protein [Sandaracinaceae bacterium]